MSDPYRPVDLGGRRRPRPPRVPDRRALLAAWVPLRLRELSNDLDGHAVGNPDDERRRLALLSRVDELRRLCRAVGLDGDTGRWCPLR